MSIITQDSLPKLRKDPAVRGKKIVFCSGVFDLTHAGHVLFFEDAKKEGDVLVVGVGNDDLIRKYKGPNRPVMNEHMRLKMIDSLKPVDYVFLQENISPDKMIEDMLTTTFLLLKPDAYVINDDAVDIELRKIFSKKYGVRLVILPRACPPEFQDVSTTSLLNKIKKIS